AEGTLVTWVIVAYGDAVEAFIACYSGSAYEGFMILNRITGPYAPFYWLLLLCNVVTPQALWLRRVRSHVPSLFVIAIIVNIGMWLERFIIVVTSLHRVFLTSSCGIVRL